MIYAFKSDSRPQFCALTSFYGDLRIVLCEMDHPNI
jgi:hypothetical protein